MGEGVLQINVASMVEDVLKQHGKRLSDVDLASRKAEEASLRRYEAAGWLRKMVGVVAGKDLPAEPSEEDFRLGLRSGIILCNVLNKIHPGAVTKVVEAPSDTVPIPDGAALSAFQYFENIRNFLVAIEEMGIPTFEASDLEQGGKSSRIVNCVLALRSYYEWKQGGGIGLWRYSGSSKPPSSAKQFFRRNSEPFMNSIPRSSSGGEKSVDSLLSDRLSGSDLELDLDDTGTSHSLHLLVGELLSDKKREDIPVIVENMLSKIMEEFENRLASQNELIRSLGDVGIPSPNKALMEDASTEIKTSNMIKDMTCGEIDVDDGHSKGQSSKNHQLVDHQEICIQGLKGTIHAAKEDVKMLQIKYQEEVNNLGKHLHGLAHAASGYQKVLEENRKLYNQVQDLKGNIRVYCRVRPFLPGQLNRSTSVANTDERSITVITPANYGKEGKKCFTFNKVFGPTASQGEVFADTQPLIRSVLDGYNVCIFAYGQTGSGKTHTMTGPSELTEESMGVNYRALSDLFLISEHRKDTICYDVSVQMIEIYNEQVRDLLVTDGNINKRLEIRNNSQNGVNVPNANLVPVTSTSDVLNLMDLGQKNRAVGSTAMNVRSSRSHSCLTVHVQGRDLTSGAILRGCMHLVDLAGSERVNKSEAAGDRLKEAQHINRSLSALGDVISSLAQKQSHVPYRNSKLTQLLQDSLGGQAKTLMFVHISPEPDAIGETLSTLKFAERVSTVELGAARANKESAEVKELKEQIASLKAALAQKEGGESGHLLYSRSSSPDYRRIKSSGSSPSRSSLTSLGDVGRAEVNSAWQSLELHDILTISPPWPPARLVEDEKEGISGDWVDKIMVNKQDGIIIDIHREKWEEESRQPPEMFYNKTSDSRRHSLDNSLPRTRSDVAASDYSDELEAATSDSSEPDNQWKLTVTRSKSIPNGIGSKVRRPPSPKHAKSPETRSLIPQPSRRLSNGLYKTSRQPSFDGRRKPSTGK